MHKIGEQLLTYLSATWRYRWWATGSAWVVAAVGWAAVAFLLPDRYEATARVYVDTQSILRPLLAGLAMQPNVNQVIEMMSRTLISRPNVEKVIQMSGLDAKLKTADERERTINRLMKELTIKGTGAQNFYSIAYSDRDPQQATRLVQSLLTLFVEGGLGDKRKDSDSARSFIDEQLEVYGQRLTAAENAVAEFKRKHLGLMPGQGQTFYTRLAESQQALNQAQLELREAQQRRDAVRRLIAEERSVVSSSAGTSALVPEEVLPEPATPDLDVRIQALQQRLDNLRLNYTEQHPDIVAMLPMIEQLQEQKRREILLQRQGARPRPAARAPAPPAPQDPLSRQVTSLAEHEANVAALTARVAEYERRYGALKAVASAIPQVEAEFTQLTRDYEVTKHNYDQLVQRREAAQLTADMQSNSGVMSFRVVDPPRVPSVPVWPNRFLLMSAVLLAAVGGGVGFAILLSQLHPTIGNERKLREIGGLPVFGTVTMAWTEAQLRGRRVDRVALIVSLLGLLTAYVAVMTVLAARRFPGVESMLRLP